MNVPPEKNTKDDKNENDHAKEKVKGLMDFVKTNPKDVVAFLILIAGVILLFFERFSGELLLGVVFGLYYSQEIQALLTHFNEFIEEQGVVRGIVLGVTALALFIAAPGVFIGALLAVIVRYLFNS